MKKNDMLAKNNRDKKRDMLINLLNNYQFKNIIPPKIHENTNRNCIPPPSLKTIDFKKPFAPKKILIPKKTQSHEERYLKLRTKFIATAKKFIGVPYGKKYLEDHPYYTGGLFLDCCGLVRKTFNSMSNDFGFQLGKWNQCYQFDILPKSIPFSQMKPGDLIFYTAEYYPDKCKKQQLHNVVHVEIFLGEGEKTIGSRDSKGVVQIYDTFQFMSENYFNIEYHFKSIDTWLKGIHKSFCKEHLWGRTSSLSMDKSTSQSSSIGKIYLPIAPSSIKEISEYDESDTEDNKYRVSGFSGISGFSEPLNGKNKKSKGKTDQRKYKVFDSLEESEHDFEENYY